jgi:hypothetical protein
MKATSVVAFATLTLTTTSAFAALGFKKQECAGYGNLIETSARSHVYENNYVQYTISFDHKGLADEMELKFNKGKKPSYQLMLSCMPNPISKKHLKWGRTTVSPDGEMITMRSHNGAYKATIRKEKWNSPARIAITKL